MLDVFPSFYEISLNLIDIYTNPTIHFGMLGVITVRINSAK